MQKRNVMRILGAGIIIVVIMGVAFFFIRGKQAEPVVEEQVKQESIFIDENTRTDPADVEIARTWEEVICEDEQKLGTITDTYLHTEPFSDADTSIKVPMKAEFIEEATCFIGNEPLNWSKVTYNGVTGYVNLLDTEYVVEVAESIEVTEEAEGVSEESIIDVAEEEQAEETAEAEPTPEVQEEEPGVEEPASSAEPQPTATPNPNVTTKTEDEKQAELQAEALKRLEALGVAESPTSDRTGNTKGYHGDGTHFGDLQ